MPQIVFPITQGELLVDVRVNRDAPTLAGIRAANQPAPPVVPTRGVIDTGSNVTGIAPAVLHRLGVPQLAATSTSGIGGSVSVLLFRVSLTILNAHDPQSPWFVLPDLLVFGLTSHVGVDVLIGMDVLLACRMLLDGPAGQFMLDF